MNTEAAKTKYATMKAALERNATVVAGLNTYRGVDDVAAFEKKFANDVANLWYSQVTVFEKCVRYVKRTRLGSH